MVLVSRLYSVYASAVRSDFTVERPAQPVLYLDGTGGRGVSHGEIGCADFKAVGDQDAKQSASRAPRCSRSSRTRAPTIRATSAPTSSSASSPTTSWSELGPLSARSWIPTI
eukprot:418596-Prymnesium_polylepis.1